MKFICIRSQFFNTSFFEIELIAHYDGSVCLNSFKLTLTNKMETQFFNLPFESNENLNTDDHPLLTYLQQLQNSVESPKSLITFLKKIASDRYHFYENSINSFISDNSRNLTEGIGEFAERINNKFAEIQAKIPIPEVKTFLKDCIGGNFEAVEKQLTEEGFNPKTALGATGQNALELIIANEQFNEGTFKVVNLLIAKDLIINKSKLAFPLDLDFLWSYPNPYKWAILCKVFPHVDQEIDHLSGSLIELYKTQCDRMDSREVDTFNQTMQLLNNPERIVLQKKNPFWAPFINADLVKDRNLDENNLTHQHEPSSPGH